MLYLRKLFVFLYDQESDKLADDDLYRYLTEMKKNSLSNRKLKIIPGEQPYCRDSFDIIL